MFAIPAVSVRILAARESSQVDAGFIGSASGANINAKRFRRCIISRLASGTRRRGPRARHQELEQFEKLLPVLDPQPQWEPLMRVEADPRPGTTAGAQQEPPGAAPIVQMLQIAIPVHEARKLGWALMETANQILNTPSSPKH